MCDECVLLKNFKICTHLHILKVFWEFLEIKYFLEIVLQIFTIFYCNHKLIFFSSNFPKLGTNGSG